MLRALKYIRRSKSIEILRLYSITPHRKLIVKFKRENKITAVKCSEEENLLEIGQRGGIDIESACEGQMGCSTCHVIIDPKYYSLLTPPSHREEDLLDLAIGNSPTSRLACQVTITHQVDGILVNVPNANVNWGRKSYK